MKQYLTLALCLSVSAITACQNAPKHKPHNSFARGPIFAPQDANTNWWRHLNDPLLYSLVETGRTSGLDVLIAQTQIDENRAFTRSQFARLFPSLNATANSDITDFPDGSAGLSLNWELDIFGAVKSSVKAAKLRGLASEAVARDVRRLISSQIVAIYIQLRARQVEYALAEQSQQRLTESVKRITRLADAGYATRLDVTRSRGQLNQISSRIASLRGQERALQNNLRQLVGNNINLPQLYTSKVNQAYIFPRPGFPQPNPNLLFAYRPDIRSAALSVNAEAYEKLAATRALYPSISFQGNSIYSAGSNTPLSVSGLSTSLIGSLVVPLLGRGRLLAQISAETAQKRRAILQYEQTVLAVVTEIDTAQTQLISNRVAADEQKKALEAAQFGLEQSNRLFEAGEISYLDVLITEQSLIDAERAVVLAEESAILAWSQYMTSLSLN